MSDSAQEVVLYEGQLASSETLIYTAPADRTVTVKSVTLTNITGSAATARIDRVPAGGSDGTTLEVVNESVAANATVELPPNGQDDLVVLQPGDELYASSGTATAIDISVSGIEDVTL